MKHNLLESVSERISGHVTDFCVNVMNTTSMAFHADELRKYVEEREPRIAPGSPDRILRRLRQKKLLNYVVIDRAKSLYRMDWIIVG